MKNRFVLLLALFASVSSAFANGDPVAYRSALTLSRTPVAVHVPQVQLLDEQCRFVLGDGKGKEIIYYFDSKPNKIYRI